MNTCHPDGNNTWVGNKQANKRKEKETIGQVLLLLLPQRKYLCRIRRFITVMRRMMYKFYTTTGSTHNTTKYGKKKKNTGTLYD